MADTFGVIANIGKLKTLLDNLENLGVADTSTLRINTAFHGQLHVYVDWEEFGTADAETLAVTPFTPASSGT